VAITVDHIGDRLQLGLCKLFDILTLPLKNCMFFFAYRPLGGILFLNYRFT